MYKSNWIKLIPLLIAIGIIVSCNNDRGYINNFRQKYDQIGIDSFNLKSTYDSDQDVTFELEWNSGNQREYLNFFGLKRDVNKKRKGEVKFLSLIRITDLDSLICEVGYNENRDTLYLLYRKGEEIKIKQGAFYYLYKYDYNSLNKMQREFFEKNKDSLTNYRINNIPELNN